MNMRYRLGSAIAAATLLFLTACGGGSNDKEPDAKPSADTSASTGASDAPSIGGSTATNVPSADPGAIEGATDFCEKQDVKSFTGPAAEEFGAENVLAAYCQMVELQFENTLISDLLRRDRSEESRVIEFAPVRGHMTPGARSDWDTAVEQLVGGDFDVLSDIWSFIYVYVTFGKGYDFWPDGTSHPTVLGTKVSPASTSVDRSGPQPRLIVSFKFDTIVNLVKGEEPYMATGTKDLSFTLVPNPSDTDIPWLIDGWNAKFGGTEPKRNMTDEF